MDWRSAIAVSRENAAAQRRTVDYFSGLGGGFAHALDSGREGGFSSITCAKGWFLRRFCGLSRAKGSWSRTR
jgi:hypothetical protein